MCHAWRWWYYCLECGRGPLNGEPVYCWRTTCDSDYVHTPYCPNFTCEDHDSRGADCVEHGMYHRRYY